MPNAWNKTHLTGTGTTVISPTPTGTAGATAAAPVTLHSVLINGAAATSVITVSDYNSTTPPAGSNIAIVTIPTQPVVPTALEMDAICTIGIVVSIATATADVTVLWA